MIRVVALLVILTSAAAAEQSSPPPAQTPECTSCTARHIALKKLQDARRAARASAVEAPKTETEAIKEPPAGATPGS